MDTVMVSGRCIAREEVEAAYIRDIERVGKPEIV